MTLNNWKVGKSLFVVKIFSFLLELSSGHPRVDIGVCVPFVGILGKMKLYLPFSH